MFCDRGKNLVSFKFLLLKIEYPFFKCFAHFRFLHQLKKQHFKILKLGSQNNWALLAEFTILLLSPKSLHPTVCQVCVLKISFRVSNNFPASCMKLIWIIHLFSIICSRNGKRVWVRFSCTVHILWIKSANCPVQTNPPYWRLTNSAFVGFSFDMFLDPVLKSRKNSLSAWAEPIWGSTVSFV